MGSIADLRQVLQDFLTPSLRRLEEATQNIVQDLDLVGKELNSLRQENKALSDRLARLEGKYEAAEEVIVKRIENAMLKKQLEALPPAREGVKS